MITVDQHSPVPPYEQVREQIRAQVDSGELRPGTKLPTVRGLAADLGIAANTVARAYRDLEALGLIETRGRAGSVVSGDGVQQAARRAAHEYVEQLRALGLDEDAALELVRRALDQARGTSDGGTRRGPPAPG
jgi:DNA-binding transcriptional regulator YhcF (GntR family)